MTVRHYYYISKSKVRMYIGQLPLRAVMSEINPEVEALGVKIGLGIRSRIEEDGDTKLARDTSKLIDALIDKKLVKSLNKSTQLDNSNFVHDVDDWMHGLYSIRDVDTGNYTITYMLWKAFGNRIFLLFGSPANVLGIGNREVKVGMEHQSASAAILNNVIESSLTDELIRAIYDCGKVDGNEKPSVTISADQDSDIEINVGNWAPIARVKAEQNVLRGSALALLCRKALTSLPSAKIETVFKIYNTLPVSRSIAPFDTLYLGSPVFTAL